MSEIEFLVPSTSFAGGRPRLRVPFTDVGVDDTGWLRGVVDNGAELRTFLDVFEPLLLAVQMAGFWIPEITVGLVDGSMDAGGIKFDTTTSRVELLTEPEAEAELGEPGPGLWTHFWTLPIATADRNGFPVNHAIPLTVDGHSETGFLIQGTGTGDARGRFREPVVAATEAILDLLEAGGGLLHVYEPAAWMLNATSTDASNAVIAIAANLNPTGQAGSVAELRTDIGDLTAPSSTAIYSMLALPERLASSTTGPDPDWLVSVLRSALVDSGVGGDDGARTTYTGALLEMHSRNVIDLLGPLLADPVLSDTQIADILALDEGLTAEEVETLCSYVSGAVGEHVDAASDRLATEYAKTDDDALKGTVIEALIAACEATEPAPVDDGEPVAAGSFEIHLVSLAGVIGVEGDGLDPDRSGAFIIDLWARWKQRLIDPLITEKFHYGAAKLFLGAADFEVEMEAVEEAAAYYSIHVVGPSEGRWRFPRDQPAGYSPPVGWSESVLTDLCHTLGQVPHDLYGTRVDAARMLIEPLVGSGLFEIHDMTRDAITARYAALLQAAAAAAGSPSSIADYADLTGAIAYRHNTDDPAGADEFAARLRLALLTWKIGELVESDAALETTLAGLRAQAAEEMIDAAGSRYDADEQKQWFTSEATLAYLRLLDEDELAVFEARELETLNFSDPDATDACILASTGNAIVAGSPEMVAELNDAEVADEYTTLMTAINRSPGDQPEIAKIVGLLKADITVYEKGLTSKFAAAEAGHLAKLRDLERRGMLFTSYDQAVDDLSAWKARNDLGLKVGSNVLSAVAGILAARKLATNGIDGTTETVSTAASVVSGAIATVEIGAVLTQTLIAGARTEPGVLTIVDDVLGLAGYLGKAVSVVGIVLSAISIANAWSSGDYFAMAIGAATLVTSVASMLISSTLVVAGIPGGQIIAVATFTLAVVAFAYEWWTREPASWATLRRYEVLWDTSVDLESPVEATVVEALAPIGSTVTPNDRVTKIDLAGRGGEAPPFGPWQRGLARMRWYEVDEDGEGGEASTQFLHSSIPGTITDHFFAPGFIVPLDDTAMTVSPLCEEVIRAPIAGTAVEPAIGAIASVGDYVSPLQPVLDIEVDGGSAATVVSLHGGRLFDRIPLGEAFEANDVLVRVLLDDPDVIVIADTPVNPGNGGGAV